MNKTNIKKIEKLLVEQKNAILHQQSKKITETNEIDNHGDETDNIQATILATVSTSLNDINTRKLSQIEQALKRIKDGTFGVCTDCGDDIGEKRLLFNPSFSICVLCAEQNEREQKQRAR